MHPIRIALLVAATVLAAAHASRAMSAPADGARTAPRHFVLVNASHESVVSFAVAPARLGTFEDVVFALPLRGGVTSETVSLPGGDCLRDLRITFDDGRTLVYPDIDTCRHRRLRLTRRDGRRGTDAPDRPVAKTP